MSWLIRASRLTRASSRACRVAAAQSAPPAPRVTFLAPNRRFAAAAAATQTTRRTRQTQQNIDPMLQRLDNDVRRFGRINRRDLDDVLKEFAHTSRVTSSQSLLVIRCCGNLVPEELPEERTKLVKEVWKSLLQRNVPIDISHYNALLRVYIENNHQFSVQNTLREIESKGIEPNRVTYQRLMWHYCQNGDIEGASKILETMREKNFPLSEAILDALVLGHVRQNNLEGAQSVLTAMSAAGISPTSRTYSILIGGSAKKGDIEEVEKMIKECENKDIFFSDRELMEILEEFAHGGHVEHVDCIINKMQKLAGYNQDAINLILRLVNKKYDDAALKVLQSMAKNMGEETPAYSCAFYIRQLVKANIPTETIVSQCKYLQSNGFAPRAFFIATDAALTQGKPDLALELLNELKLQNQPIRCHYFWPIFVSYGNEKNTNEVLNTIEKMIRDFEIYPNVETLRDYVIPHMDKNASKIVELLRTKGIPSALSIRSTLFHLLSEDIHRAAEFASQYGTKTSTKSIFSLLNNVIKTESDIDPVVKIVNVCCNENLNAKQSSNEEEEAVSVQKVDHREQVGILLKQMVYYMPNSSPLHVDILKKFYDSGLGITNAGASSIQEAFGDRITTEISDLLVKLTSDDLSLVEHELGPLPPVRRNYAQLQKIISELEGKGENPIGLKKQMLFTLIRSREVEKMEELMEKMKEEKFHFTAGILSQIMDLYAVSNELTKAVDTLRQIKSLEPNFVIDSIKLLKLAALMIRKDKIDEAISLLSQHESKKLDEEHYFNAICWQILNNLAEKGDVENVNKLFNVLNEKNYIEISNVIMGPLIRVHLVTDNCTEALKTFEELCHRYKCTPLKNELNKKLILNEDANGLQKVTDLSTTVHGEINSLYDLVFAFVECGRLKQARRILETPGMRTRNQRITTICERYNVEGKTEYLEGLLEATRDLSHIDRSEVFNNLLKNYIKNDDSEKALGLWTLLQEENIPPSDKFLITLAQYLKSKNVDVPFVIPGVAASGQTESETKVVEVEQSNKVKLDYLIESGKYSEATSMIVMKLKSGEPIRTGLLKFTLNQLSKKGLVDLINTIGDSLSEKQKRQLSFDNRKCFGIYSAGDTSKFLDELETEIDSVKTDVDIQNVRSKFPVGAIVSMTSAETYDQVKRIAKKYFERNILIPFNSLWTYNMMTKNFKEAQNVWDEYLMNYDKIMFRQILQQAHKNKDVELLSHLFNVLKTNSNVSSKALGVIVSRKMDVLLLLNKCEEATNCLDQALAEKVTIADVNKTCLIRLRTLMESTGKKFNYVIPEK